MFSAVLLLAYFTFTLQFQEYYSNHVHKHLAAKTPYRTVLNKDVSPVIYSGCQPTKIWMVIRHGTRLPSKKFIKEMKHRLPRIRDQIIENSVSSDVKLDQKQLDDIRNWNLTIHKDNEKILTHEGEDELLNLAERMQKRFPSVLPNIYSNTSYKFRYTATQRTQKSAHYFATGLFGRNTANHVWYPEAMKQDPILRFYKLCNKWRNEIKKNPQASMERDLFKNGIVMQNTLQNVSAKLGFKENLDFDDVHTMYMTCAFETSWEKNKLSPWCSAFNNDTIKVMEYTEDLKYYWLDGYGYNLTFKQACPAVNNMVEFFQSKEDNPKAVLYFTHSGTMLKLLAHLGLYKDEIALKHDNFHQHSDRLWRATQIDAFASNLATVLYRCENNIQKILLLHQERKVKMPCSTESELCNFNDFLNTYNDSINNCNFHKMCSLS